MHHPGLDRNGVRIYYLIFENPAYEKMLGLSVAQASIRVTQVFVFSGLGLMRCRQEHVLIWLRTGRTLVLILQIGSCSHYEQKGVGWEAFVCVPFFFPDYPQKNFQIIC